MASWEDELSVLLRELGVTQEEQKEQEQRTHRSSMQAEQTDFSRERFPVPRRNEVKRKVQSADAFFWRRKGDSMDSMDGMASMADSENDEAWLSDLRVMRREVESIVSQVVHLMQHGDLDPALKEDVLVVLRALKRRASVTQQADASDTAYLEFAAAMLHFCRLVLRLSEVSPEEL
jgi:hypothetical protein